MKTRFEGIHFFVVIASSLSFHLIFCHKSRLHSLLFSLSYRNDFVVSKVLQGSNLPVCFLFCFRKSSSERYCLVILTFLKNQ